LGLPDVQAAAAFRQLSNRGVRYMIPFDEINAAALVGYAERLAGWFPAGKLHGREFVMGDLSGAPGRSLSVNTRTGSWGDFSGGEKGGDPVSLYAAAFHGGDMGDAAREMARELGITLDERAPAARKSAAPAPKREPDEHWTPFLPPEDAADPPLSGYDGVWVYRDADGRRVGFVVRINASEKNPRKITFGINWGRRIWTPDRGTKKGVPQDVTGWHNKHPAEPLPLYGLELLAARPDAPVLVVEGEKACDAARAMFAEHVCVSWMRGVENVDRADWSPLTGRWVIIWPDNDPPNKKGVRVGIEAAKKLEAILRGAAKDVVILDIDDVKLGDKPNGEDAADITVTDPAAWLEAHLGESYRQAELPAEELLSLEEVPPHEPCGEEYQPPTFEPEEAALGEGVVPLGHDRQVYFYYSVSAKQIAELSPGQHTRMWLEGLADGPNFWEAVPHLQLPKGGVDWAAAGGWLMSNCRKVGIFNPERVRGRGCWLDDGRAVLNIGDRLIVDGQSKPLLLKGSKYLYEAGNSFMETSAAPLNTAEANKLVKVCEALRWERPVNAKLFAGFIVASVICGGLKWRPSIWVTGGAGSGKTFAMNSVMKKVVGKLALHVKASTTEAGIRSALGSDARPVIFDEAERESPAAAMRMQATLELVRQSSSADDGEIIKGTQKQKAKTFRIQSSFAFQSVNVGLEFAADMSRITVLVLREGVKASAEDIAKFAEIEAMANDTFTLEYSAGLLARAVSLLPVIRENAETFARAIAKTLGNRRMGDQLGALLAGAWSLSRDRLVTQEEAETYIAAGDWAETTEASEEKDEMKCVRQLMAHRLRDGSVEYSIGRLLENLNSISPEEKNPSDEKGMRMLLEAGIKFGKMVGQNGIYVATTHPELKKAFAGTPWSVGWARSMARLPYAKASTELKTVRFSMGSTSRAVWLPMASIDAPE
jgi:putative DNA primase/helicase